MNNGPKIGAILAILMSTIQLRAQNPPADPCIDLASLSVAKARSVLKSNANTGSYSSRAECLSAAIDKLGEHRDPQDIPLLISYLAFVRPVSPSNPDVPTMHPVTPDHGYPAIEALAAEGETAREPLLVFIGEETDGLKRHNAAYALIRIKPLTPEIAVSHLNQKRMAANSEVASRYDDAIAFAKTTWPCKKRPDNCEKASPEK